MVFDVCACAWRRLEVAAEGLGFLFAAAAIGELRDVFAVFAHQINPEWSMVYSFEVSS
jgi:hypothetical protein